MSPARARQCDSPSCPGTLRTARGHRWHLPRGSAELGSGVGASRPGSGAVSQHTQRYAIPVPGGRLAVHSLGKSACCRKQRKPSSNPSSSPSSHTWRGGRGGSHLILTPLTAGLCSFPAAALQGMKTPRSVDVGKQKLTNQPIFLFKADFPVAVGSGRGSDGPRGAGEQPGPQLGWYWCAWLMLGEHLVHSSLLLQAPKYLRPIENRVTLKIESNC